MGSVKHIGKFLYRKCLNGDEGIGKKIPTWVSSFLVPGRFAVDRQHENIRFKRVNERPCILQWIISASDETFSRRCVCEPGTKNVRAKNVIKSRRQLLLNILLFSTSFDKKCMVK